MGHPVYSDQGSRGRKIASNALLRHVQPNLEVRETSRSNGDENNDVSSGMLRHVVQWKLTDVLRNAYCLHHHGASQKTVVFNLARSLALIPVLDSLQMASMCPYPAETEGRQDKQSRGCLCLGAY
jgi:hypothetical protein